MTLVGSVPATRAGRMTQWAVRMTLSFNVLPCAAVGGTNNFTITHGNNVNIINKLKVVGANAPTTLIWREILKTLYESCKFFNGLFPKYIVGN
jgi:hypothetical protein